MRNAMLPVITTIGLQIGSADLRRGAHRDRVRLPGHRLVHGPTRSSTRDYPVLQGFIIFIAIVYAFINLAVDVSYSFIDPRVRVS